MEFQIHNLRKSSNDIMRTIGYQPAYFQNEGEVSIVRQIGRNDYPRFHLYIKPASAKASDGLAKANYYIFSLHLDQKKPSYEGQTGHSGDYDGDVVEGEAQRIKNLLGSSF